MTDGNLTISRINRLLRPLRNTCATLASFSLSTGASTATYSSRPERVDILGSSALPLEILQSPENAVLRLNLDTKSLELSRKIYAVRDCFRNVVQAVSGPQTRKASRGARILSLAAMCSIVVGQNMQPESDDDEDDDDPVEEEEMLELVNELYEAIPPPYRRWALTAHALDIVFGTCPRHHTLLKILLDVCLASNLQYECQIIIKYLLSFAVAPLFGTGVPRMCHPAHSTYLTDLRGVWIGAGHTNRTLVGALIESLANGNGTVPSAWGSKAVKRLAYELRTDDFPAYIDLLHGLTKFIAVVEQASQPLVGRCIKRKRQERPREDITLRARLSKWIDIASEHIFHISEQQFDNSENESFSAVIKLLECVRAHKMHMQAPKDGESMGDDKLQDAIMCLATNCMFAPRTLSDPFLPFLVGFSEETRPTSSTFSSMVAQVFERAIRPIPSIAEFEDCKRALETKAAALKSHGLLRLEAAVWQCAPRHIDLLEKEMLVSVNVGYKAVVRRYRLELIDRADEVSRVCFESVTGPETLEREWEWEEMVGCWVRKTALSGPSRKKKMKLEHSTDAPRFSKRLSSRKANISTDRQRHQSVDSTATSSTNPSSVVTSGTFSSRERPSESPTYLSDITDAEDDDEFTGETTSESVVPSTKRTRMISNFASILTDALSNRTSIHQKPRVTDVVRGSSSAVTKGRTSTPFLRRNVSSFPLSPVRRHDPYRSGLGRLPSHYSPEPEPAIPSSDPLDCLGHPSDL